MSQAAKDMLIDAGTNRQGTSVTGPATVRAELAALGLIGQAGGLTRKGSIARERLVNEMLDAAF